VTSGVSAIGEGSGFALSCAIMLVGLPKCWQFASATSVDAQGFPNAAAIVVGGQTTGCVLLVGGGVMCSKSSSSGGYSSTAPTWVTIDGLTATSAGSQTPGSTVATGNTSAIAMGLLHTCALTSVGGVKCWGYNRDGELGNGSTADSAAPVNVAGLTTGVTAIATGSQFTCALTTDGAVKCWGLNGNGQLGTGAAANSLIPVAVSGLSSGVTAISASFDHACALSSGGVKCWGLNQYGELGNGLTTNSSTPVAVTGLTTGVSAIAASTNNTCALTTSGGVKCWGFNLVGQLGNGVSKNSLTPVDVTGLTSGASAITASANYACALTGAGAVKCWGANPAGQAVILVPIDIPGLSGGVSAIAAGEGFTCALTTDGGVKCWGNTLGNGTSVSSKVPVDVVGLPIGIKTITAGDKAVCAITITGTIKCWGGNYGTIPAAVPGL
jgi:alpha-tubulin suppressor-like RCC1 family protein